MYATEVSNMKENKKKSLLVRASEVWMYIKISLAIASVLYIIFNSGRLGTWSFFNAWGEFLYSFLISLALSLGIATIIAFTEKRISWIDAPVKRLLTELTTVVIYSTIVSILFSVVTITIFYKVSLTELPWDNIWRNTKFPILISIFMTAILTSRAFLFEWRRAAIASEKLRADRFQGQYQSLKNQLNPHFLFNSLNTLSNLVYDDQEKAIEFIQKLSKIYRYVLEVQKEELVTIKQELVFLENYLGLQKLRFGENLQIAIQVLNQDLLIPPLSLQLLLENCIKHNIVSSDEPLKITISETEGHIIIKNNLQPKDLQESSTGIGLENIKSRLAYFTEKPLLITKSEREFIVQVPVLSSP